MLTFTGGETRLYKLSDEKGTYIAEYISSFTTGGDWETCRVTSADISDDGKTVVLLGYGKIWVFKDFATDNFFEGTFTEIDLGVRTQLESISFTGPKTLILSDEKNKAGGGHLYQYELK